MIKKEPRVKYRIVDTSATVVPEKKPSPKSLWERRRNQPIVKRWPPDQRPTLITEWFYDEHLDDICPAITSAAIATAFHESTQSKGFQLDMHFEEFLHRISVATSAFAFHRFFGGPSVGAPKKTRTLPKGWTHSTEVLWMDYLISFVFTNSFWEVFWRNIPPSIWEERMPSYRTYIQSILPYFVQRTFDPLVEEELVAQNDKGDFVDPTELGDDEDYRFHD